MIPIDFGVFRSLCSCPQISEGQSLHVSIALAKFFLPFFEEKYPNDNRPREAIEAAESWLADPSEENVEKVVKAARGAWDTLVWLPTKFGYANEAARISFCIAEAVVPSIVGRVVLIGRVHNIPYLNFPIPDKKKFIKMLGKSR